MPYRDVLYRLLAAFDLIVREIIQDFVIDALDESPVDRDAGQTETMLLVADIMCVQSSLL